MKICFASKNLGKVSEIADLAPPGIEVYGLDQLNVLEDIPETGNTMEENSFLKADYVFSRFKVPVFADDSGLEVHALNNDPGVYSARYAGPEKNDEANNALLISNLNGIEDRSAQFKTVITLIDATGESHQFTGIMEGVIEEMPRGSNGFGYDPIFTPKEYSRTFAEMKRSEKNMLSHRAKAFEKLISYLKGL